MPKELTHWIVAEDAADLLEKHSIIRRIITQYRNTYLAASVVPDTPIHAMFGSCREQVKRAGTRFHDNPGNTADYLAESLLYFGEDGDAVLAVAAGILAHIAADTIFHPMVYYFSGTASLVRHLELETWIDVYFRQTGKPPAERLAHLLKHLEIPIHRFSAIAARMLDLTDESCQRTFEATLAFHRFVQGQYDNTPAKLVMSVGDFIPLDTVQERRNLFYPVVRPPREALFPEPLAWEHPVTGEGFTTSLEELRCKAARNTYAMLRRMDQLLPDRTQVAAMLKSLQCPNLITGLYGITGESMRHFDTEIDLMRLIKPADETD